MSEPEDFLSRWSRRKLEQAEPASSKTPEAAGNDEKAASAATPDAAKTAAKTTAVPAGQELPFDVSTLPPLESIGPQSDISAFLAKGVPGELSRAALRRAWSADPAIRDFVGLAENSWDFTAPDSMPGFGPLLPSDDVKRMVAQIFSQDEIKSPTSSGEAADEAGKSSEPAPQIGSNPNAESGEIASNASGEGQQEAQTLEVQSNNPAITAQDRMEKNEEDIAVQQDTQPAEDNAGPVRRAHGGALPS
jgi:uncharacterized protein DUF3306